MKRTYGNALRWLRQKGQSKATQEIITVIPVIENKFDLDTAEVEKIIQKYSHCIWALFETRESLYIKFLTWYYVFVELFKLVNTLGGEHGYLYCPCGTMILNSEKLDIKDLPCSSPQNKQRPKCIILPSLIWGEGSPYFPSFKSKIAALNSKLEE